MRAVATALLLAAALLSLFALPRLATSPFFVAPAAVAIGVIASVVVAGGWTWLAVIFGALAPLSLQWVAPWNTTVGIGLVCLLWLAPRAWVARSHKDLVVFAVSAVTASIVAGAVAAHFLDASLGQHVASCIFAGAALAVTTIVVRGEPPVAHALEVAGRALEGSVRDALLRAAGIRRAVQVRPQSERGNWQLWRRLAMRADARVGLNNVPGAEAEQQRKDLDREILILVDRLTAAAPDAVSPPKQPSDTTSAPAVAPAGESESASVTPAVEAVRTAPMEAPQAPEAGGSR